MVIIKIERFYPTTVETKIVVKNTKIKKKKEKNAEKMTKFNYEQRPTR